MKILVLDDNIDRHVDFIRRWRDKHTIVNVGNFEEAVHALQYGSPFDVLHLDHDLGEKRNGTDVVRYLIHAVPRQKWPQQVVVHSQNFIGGPRMVRLLRDAGIPANWKPFSFHSP